MLQDAEHTHTHTGMKLFKENLKNPEEVNSPDFQFLPATVENPPLLNGRERPASA